MANDSKHHTEDMGGGRGRGRKGESWKREVG